jgi:hypothetical protein
MSSVRFSFPRLVLVSLLFGAAVSCSSTSVFQLSADEQSLLQSAMNTPLTFVVPRDQTIASWDRAVDFVQRYSTMKLRSATDSLITVYDEPSVTPLIENASSIRFGYSVGRSRDPGGMRYTVQCTASSTVGQKDALQNAHIAAYYVKTGSVCDRCIIR